MRKSKILLGLLLIQLGSHSSIALEPPDKGDVAIFLKKKVVVLGPEIKLGDIGEIVLSDTIDKRRLASVKIGQAPPPGESKDFSLSYIKRCLRSAGFCDYISVLHGPHRIRIVTAQVEIDKVFLKGEFVAIESLRFFRKIPKNSFRIIKTCIFI